MRRPTIVASCVLFFSLSSQISAQDQLPRRLADSLPSVRIAGLRHSAIGVTRRGTSIGSLLCDEDFDFATSKVRVLLVGGTSGSPDSVKATLSGMRWFYESPAAAPLRKSFALSAVPCVNPDGLSRGTRGDNTVGGNPASGYPPQGTAYNSATDPEAAYLWRWIGMHAPDLVVDVRTGTELGWRVPASRDPPLQKLAKALDAAATDDTDDQLVSQLVKVAPSETGTVPALAVRVPGAAPDAFLPALLAALKETQLIGPSPARRELERRLDRTALQVAEQLSDHYGHDLKQVAYIPALALVGRIRLGELTGRAEHLKDVERIAAPYFSGQQQTLTNSGSNLSGHLIFCELARVTSGEPRERYIRLARNASDLGFDEQGRVKSSMPFHVEMSDSVFMGGPILARVGRLTGDRRYFDACARHVRFMRKLVLRPDGIYRHSPLDEAAWGRGNGFPALGVAMCLTDFPDDHPDRPELLRAFQDHIRALAAHQDPTGCWHEVIDREESYRELTSTCMITFAMIRGVRRGWLDREKYGPAIERGWRAIRTRVAPSGRLVDVCTGTGKQQGLRDYYDRTAILGPDARGGAMSLMVSTEMARWQAELKKGGR